MKFKMRTWVIGKVAAQVGQELVWVQNACSPQTETKTETGSSSQGYIALEILWLALFLIPSPASSFDDNSKARYPLGRTLVAALLLHPGRFTLNVCMCIKNKVRIAFAFSLLSKPHLVG